jgi:hypothetical protein
MSIPLLLVQYDQAMKSSRRGTVLIPTLRKWLLSPILTIELQRESLWHPPESGNLSIIEICLLPKFVKHHLLEYETMLYATRTETTTTFLDNVPNQMQTSDGSLLSTCKRFASLLQISLSKSHGLVQSATMLEYLQGVLCTLNEPLCPHTALRSQKCNQQFVTTYDRQCESIMQAMMLVKDTQRRRLHAHLDFMFHCANQLQWARFYQSQNYVLHICTKDAMKSEYQRRRKKYSYFLRRVKHATNARCVARIQQISKYKLGPDVCRYIRSFVVESKFVRN